MKQSRHRDCRRLPARLVKADLLAGAALLAMLLLAACGGPASVQETPAATAAANTTAREEVEPLPTPVVAEVMAAPTHAPTATPLPVPAAENSPLPLLQLAQRWRHEIEQPFAGVGFVSMDGGPVPDMAAVSEAGEVVTLSKNNRTYWTESLADRPSAFAVGQVFGRDNGDVAVGLEGGGIQLLELVDGLAQAEVIWRYDTATPVTFLQFAAGTGDNSRVGLLAGTQDGQLLIFDRQNTPMLLASASIGESAVRFAASLVGESAEPLIVALTDSGLLSAVSEDGQIRWQHSLAAPPSQLTVADLDGDGQREIAVALTTGEVVAIDEQGGEIWRWQGPAAVEALVAADLGGGTYLLAISENQLSALSGGAAIWQYQLAEEGRLTALDAGDLDGDGRSEIVTGGSDGSLWILDDSGLIRGRARLARAIDDVALVNLDRSSAEPELVVWGSSTLMLFAVQHEVKAPPAGPDAPGRVLPDGAEPDGLPQYSMQVDLDGQEHRAWVQQEVSIRNWSEDAWQEVIFHVATAYWPGIFTLNSTTVTQDDTVTAADGWFESTMLHIPLATPLEPGQEVNVALDFQLDLPALNPTSWGPEGNAGWGPTIIQMGDWYPALIPYQSGSGWQTWGYKPVGDPVISPLADYEVTIQPYSAMVLAAAGAQDKPAGGAQQFVLNGARAFSFLASPNYVLKEGEAGGIPIKVYTTPGYEEAGAVVLETAVEAINLFSDLYGPYPYDELVIAENGYLSAMEYSGLISLSGYAFEAYDGTASSLLVAITAHEVAHQWWYGGVGNDQVHEPWLDEGLAMMSELLFYEHYHPGLVAWWWGYRVDVWNPVGYVDDPIYQYDDSESFVHNVYGVSAYFMDELRDLMGQQAFEEFLQDYFAEHRAGFATRDDFFAAVRQHTDADLAPLIGHYFIQQ